MHPLLLPTPCVAMALFLGAWGHTRRRKLHSWHLEEQNCWGLRILSRGSQGCLKALLASANSPASGQTQYIRHNTCCPVTQHVTSMLVGMRLWLHADNYVLHQFAAVCLHTPCDGPPGGCLPCSSLRTLSPASSISSLLHCTAASCNYFATVKLPCLQVVCPVAASQ
jgi:hypothetical protein